MTLWLTLGIVAWLTIGLTASRCGCASGLPPADSTQIAEVARAAAGGGALFAAFQLTSAVLLLAAASSSYQAGPGLLKALSRGAAEGHGVGVLPAPLGAANRHHTPYWGVVVFFCVAAVVVAAAGGREQELVLFYAVAVFMSFLFGLLSMAVFSRREGARLFLVLNAVAIAAVARHAGGQPPPGLPDRLARGRVRDRARAPPPVDPGGPAARGVRGRATGRGGVGRGTIDPARGASLGYSWHARRGAFVWQRSFPIRP